MDNQKIKVLVAEDEFLVSEEIARSVKNIGYNLVGVASDGEQAVQLTCNLKPDVILMDLKMPKMDGLEAAKMVREKCPTPIVVLTAHESMDLVSEASQMGVSAFLTKPPNQEEIERAITIADIAQSKTY